MPKTIQAPPTGIVNKILLKRRYGPHVTSILLTSDYLRPLPRKKGEVAKYQALKALPTVEEFKALRAKHFTSTISDLVSDAKSAAEELAQELEEWYEALPENFQQGDKGQELQEAKDALEGIDWPEVDEASGKLTALYIPAEEITSRADRARDAAGRLAAAVEALRDRTQEFEAIADAAGAVIGHEKGDGWDDEEISATSDVIVERAVKHPESMPPDWDKLDLEALENLAESLESAQQELEGVEFPGMY